MSGKKSIEHKWQSRKYLLSRLSSHRSGLGAVYAEIHNTVMTVPNRVAQAFWTPGDREKAELDYVARGLAIMVAIFLTPSWLSFKINSKLVDLYSELLIISGKLEDFDWTDLFIMVAGIVVRLATIIEISLLKGLGIICALIDLAVTIALVIIIFIIFDAKHMPRLAYEVSSALVAADADAADAKHMPRLAYEVSSALVADDDDADDADDDLSDEDLSDEDRSFIDNMAHSNNLTKY